MKDKIDNLSIGLILGIIMPPVAFYIFSIYYTRDETAMELISGYARRHVLTHVISLAVIINLPLFFGFIGTNREKSARGVIGATILYALLIVYLKFLA